MLLMATSLMYGCAAPTVKLDDVLLQRLTTERIEVGMILDLFNPNDFGMPLETIDWGLRLFQSPFANGIAKFGRQIPARQSSRVEVPLGVRFADVASSVQQVVSSRTIPWNIGGTCNFRLPTGPLAIGYQNAGSWQNPLYR